jgi:hypothetical protein
MTIPALPQHHVNPLGALLRTEPSEKRHVFDTLLVRDA